MKNNGRCAWCARLLAHNCNNNNHRLDVDGYYNLKGDCHACVASARPTIIIHIDPQLSLE